MENIENTENTGKTGKTGKTKNIIIAIIVLLVIGAVVWGASSSKTGLDLGGKGEVVATVNGEKIYKSEFDKSKESFVMQQGVDLATIDEETIKQFDQQIIDNLVTNELLVQAVKNKDIKISDEELQSQISNIKSQFENDEGFKKALEENSITEEEFMDQVKLDLGIQKLFETELNFSAITVTEEEINNIYKETAAVQEGLPPLEESKPQIEQFPIQQKQQQLITEFISKLKSEAKIEIK